MTEFVPMVAGFLLTLMLHATVLLGAVWILERLRVLRHPGWCEMAWRGALFGALCTASIAHLAPTGTRMPAFSHPASDSLPMMRASPPVRTEPLSSPVVREETAMDPNGRTAAVLPALHSPLALPVARRPLPSDATLAANDAADALRIALPDSVSAALVSLWFATLLFGTARLLRRSRGLHRLVLQRDHGARVDAELAAHATRIAAALHAPRPRVGLAADLASPLALPGARLLLPEWTTRLAPDERDALLAHEVAHLARRDPRWRIAQHLALVPLALHPLAWYASRRLESLAETQADALAARWQGDGRPLARCLAHCLQHSLSRAPVVPRFALAMAERPGAVVDRVQRLLEEDPMDYRPPSRLLSRTALALGLVAALTLPAVAITAFAGGASTSISIHGDDGDQRVSIEMERNNSHFGVEMRGRVEFAPDESDVVAMAPGAELEIAETRAGVTRAIVFEPADRGVSHAYRVDGAVRELNADGRAWLAQAIPTLFRVSGLDAAARVQRILARGGVDGVLDEVELLETDHARARYLGLLFGTARLPDAQLQRALTLTERIGSDFELRQALAEAVKSSELPPSQQVRVLAAAVRIGSDFERAELLLIALPRFVVDATTRDAWRTAFDGIGSDFEQRRVLEGLFAAHRDSPEALRLGLQATADISSDFERRVVLETLVSPALADPELLREHLALVRGMGSDFEQRQALHALLAGAPVGPELAVAVLDTVDAGIGSDFEAAQVLVDLAQRMPRDEALIARYRASARRLSDHERGEAERALDRFFVAL